MLTVDGSAMLGYAVHGSPMEDTNVVDVAVRIAGSFLTTFTER
ncbi:MAG: hypothetical protein ACOCYE_07940 [Pseudomonadota bacterium]